MLGEHLNSDDWDSDYAGEAVQQELESIVRNPNRKGSRTGIVAAMTLSPANSSQRTDWKIAGCCRDISPKGIGTILDRPARVGDFYWVEIDSELLKYQTGIGRCIRCQFLREDAYEAGFEFMTETSPQLNEPMDSGDSLI